MRLLLVALLVICSTSARAQFGGIQMKTGTGAGTILQGAPYFMFGGAGITCAYDSTSQSDKCTVAAGAGGTLQQAYNNGGAGITTIIEDTTRLGIAIRDSSPSQGTATIFGVQSNDGTTTKFLDIPATGSITMSSGQTSTASPQYVFGGATDYATPGTVAFRLQQNSPAKTYFEIAPTANGPTVNYKDGNGNTQVSTSINSGSQWVIGSAAAVVRSGSVDFGANNNAWTNGYFTNVLAATSAALTITANAASTWSTSAGALTVSGFGGINEQVNGTTVVDVGVTTSTAVTLAANKGLIGAAGTGVVTLGSMTGDMTLPTGSVSWAGAAAKTLSLVGASTAVVSGTSVALQVSGTTYFDVGLTGNSVSVAAQKDLDLGAFTTAQLLNPCADGALAWDSTTTQVKRCLSNAWSPLTAGGSETNYSAYNAANLASATVFSQTVVTNASTLVAGSNMIHDIAGTGSGTFVAKLCSDGATCAGGNVYLTCTAGANCATAAAGRIDACTITKSAVPAGTTLTWSVATACGSLDPGVNVIAHMTVP